MHIHAYLYKNEIPLEGEYQKLPLRTENYSQEVVFINVFPFIPFEFCIMLMVTHLNIFMERKNKKIFK